MIYFDNSATSYPKPKEVSKAVYDSINSFGNANRGIYSESLEASNMIYSTRRSIAQLFNIDNPLDVAFTSNITESLNAIISTMFRESDHIITTMLEHNSVLRPLYKQDCDITFVENDIYGNIKYDTIKNLIKPNTKAIICNHGSNVTGNVTNIDYIGEICRKKDILFILDSAQTAGIIDIDVKQSGVDILCFTGHKSLLGPQGTGGICLNSNKNIKLKPFKAGGSGTHSFEKEHPCSMPDCFEAGTLNSHSIAGLNASLKYIEQTGIENIYNKEMDLTWHFYNNIKHIENIKIYGDFSKYKRCPVVSLNISDISSSDISQELFESYGIATRSGAHCAPLIHKFYKTENQGMVRFSFSYFNTFDEVEIAINAIEKISKY